MEKALCLCISVYMEIFLKCSALSVLVVEIGNTHSHLIIVIIHSPLLKFMFHIWVLFFSCFGSEVLIF